MYQQWIKWICLIVLTTTSCSQEIRMQGYPKILTLPVNTISYQEFEFNANIIQEGTQAIEEVGFYWDRVNVTDPENANRTEAQLTEDRAGFSGAITYALTGGHEFYVRAYCRTADYLILGEEKRFIGRGGNRPIITSISPAAATWGDDVIINGTGFSSRFEQNEVYIDNMLARVKSFGPEEVICVMPDSIMGETGIIRLISDGETAPGIWSIPLSEPSVTKILPNPVPQGERIEIIGDGFALDPIKNQVVIGNYSFIIISSSKTKIIARPPSTLAPNSYFLRVITNGRETIAPDPFTILP